MKLEKGIFTISLDFELIWGTLDLFGTEGFDRACKVERAEVIDRLLELFNEFEISATWCTLGHLFLENCRANGNNKKHPEIVPPRHRWHQDDWFTHDPCDNEADSPLFYGKSLVEKIINNPVKQEIGSHGFSHVIFGDEGCSVETARSEIAECVRLAKNFDLDLSSFAFPRDQVGHLNVLKEYGFNCYRGQIPKWYEAGENRNLLKRLAHFTDVLLATTPPTVLPALTKDGLWNIPGSMIFFPMHGVRRYIPMSLRVKRAVKGLNEAVSRKRIFHLWFHPTNMAFEIDRMFDGLRQIIASADRLRQQGVMEILTMSEIVEIANGRQKSDTV
jgi:peptidoglycan/xylan/chitin deacetylase (PgdA/CDA1 family)